MNKKGEFFSNFQCLPLYTYTIYTNSKNIKGRTNYGIFRKLLDKEIVNGGASCCEEKI